MSDPVQDWYEKEEEKGLGKNYFTIKGIIGRNIDTVHDHELFLSQVKKEAKEYKVPLRQVMGIIRIAMTGKIKGLPLWKVLYLLEAEKIVERFNDFYAWLKPGWRLSKERFEAAIK